MKNPKDKNTIQRLITIAFILSTRDEVHIEELCERLEITEEQLKKDINILMFCGLPPYSPEQLFDIYIEDDFVSMYFNDVFVDPLRLSDRETMQILIALSRLATTTTVSKEKELIESTISIINSSKSNPIKVEAPTTRFDSLIFEALETKTSLLMKYFSYNSGEVNERIILPKQVVNTASVSYLFAYDSASQDDRIFRMDRIVDMQKSNETVIESKEADRSEVRDLIGDEEVIKISEDKNYVDLKISPLANWVLDSIPQEPVDAEKGIYRFYTNSSFFVARLLLSNIDQVRYIGGTIEKKAIVSSIQTINNRMYSTRMA